MLQSLSIAGMMRCTIGRDRIFLNNYIAIQSPKLNIRGRELDICNICTTKYA
jgi:hypothetical protein